MKGLRHDAVFGFVKPYIDVHTLGITTAMNLLRDCGYRTVMAGDDVAEAVVDLRKVNNFGLLRHWIEEQRITELGFSYRLGPAEACDYFCNMWYRLRDAGMMSESGGRIEKIFFAGLPDACDLVRRELGDGVLLFKGDETPVETLRLLGVPESELPRDLVQTSSYDKMRRQFAEELIASEKYRLCLPQDHYGYDECGTGSDSFVKRLEYCRSHHSLPIIRAHAGPYNPDRREALAEFDSWVRELSRSRLLDVLSIGSSQLTQSAFGEEWHGRPNGGGVPVNSEAEYRAIAEAARPMLVRTYAGTKDVPALAAMHERTLNISWHALSFWWFCEIDGRGPNTVLESLREHIEAIRYIASTGKPLEPNVPHHFAFRGADDPTYVISAYLAAKTAKKFGIRHLILQNMLNTPKYTWGVQDLAKGRAMLRLVRSLEDADFRVSLQARAGLDYFAPDLEKAKVQLAEVTALMDDIEPDNPDSPEIIHVVSYSEAVRLATPPVIEESIRITLTALHEYRRLRREGAIENMACDCDVADRERDLCDECREAIALLERTYPDLYTPEGLFRLFERGFLPVPYMPDIHRKYPMATAWRTAIRNGGIRVVDDDGNVIRTADRYRKIIDR